MQSDGIHQEMIPVELDDGVRTSITVSYRDDAAPSPLLLVFPPHPALGGDTENNVVRALTRAGAEHRWLSATFDYRGVENGLVGDEDMMTYWDRLDAGADYTPVEHDALCIRQALATSFGCEPVMLFAAYSFGNWIAMRLARNRPPSGLAGLSPPLGDHDFDSLAPVTYPARFFAAAEDAFCPWKDLSDFARTARSGARQIDSDDHFFRGHEQSVAREVIAFLDWTLSEGK